MPEIVNAILTATFFMGAGWWLRALVSSSGIRKDPPHKAYCPYCNFTVSSSNRQAVDKIAIDHIRHTHLAEWK